MTNDDPKEQSLVLYKGQPARVAKITDKLEIELADGETKRVRVKDVELLHPGPLQNLSQLKPLAGEVDEAWDILAGSSSGLAEIAELIFGEYTPSSAWAAWQIVAEGLLFHGTPAAITARSHEEVEGEKKRRSDEIAEKKAWEDFLDHVRKGTIAAEERRFLGDVEAMAFKRTTKSRVLRELGRQETPENAHALLLRLGVWTPTINPYPSRFDLPYKPPAMDLPELAEETRRDLTHLPAFAIDDEGNKDPDDAVSLEGDRLWVHVADVAALITPTSSADLEARGMGSNLYLPERTVSMLPPEATDRLGLGLQETSPALSFAIRLDESGAIRDVEVVASRVKVTRMSYAQADTRLDEEPFRQMVEMTARYRRRRLERGTAQLELPEVKIRVEEGQVKITKLPPLQSRELVTDAMLMAGEAAARYALKHEIPFPFTTQEPPETIEHPTDLAGMFQYRKKFKRSQMKSIAEPHAGLGLEVYARATSPLRRYLDMVVHQQLRSYLRGEPLMNPQEVLTRVGAAEAVLGHVRWAERLSNQHWTLVYLMQNPGWRGQGILVDKYHHKGTFLLPELGFEAKVQLTSDPPFNTEMTLEAWKIDLPNLQAHFRAAN